MRRRNRAIIIGFILVLVLTYLIVIEVNDWSKDKKHMKYSQRVIERSREWKKQKRERQERIQKYLGMSKQEYTGLESKFQQERKPRGDLNEFAHERQNSNLRRRYFNKLTREDENLTDNEKWTKRESIPKYGDSVTQTASFTQQVLKEKKEDRVLSGPSQTTDAELSKIKKDSHDSITDNIKSQIDRITEALIAKSNKSLLLGSVFNPEGYLAAQHMTKGTGSPMKRFQFNQIASDSTSFDRVLWDIRNPVCKSKYSSVNLDELPQTSVIICFHNEARSALLRTIYSVLNQSPYELLKEILLVDDFSEDPLDGELLKTIPKVKVMRLEHRQGLIRARLAGSTAAVGEVLVFLDSHCEVTIGWLEPLLVRIKEDKKHVVSPVIDIINKDNMKYVTANSNIKGGFGPNLHFKWEVLNYEQMQDRRDDSTSPIVTPAIAGGLFAVDKDFFEYIGSYDDQMEIWGGENVEMSMRIWMCGATLEIMPCSRVGHIFRSTMPYGFGPGKTYHSTVTKNLRRTAEVWMDEKKSIFYKAQPAAKNIEFGNISSRLALKKRLNCKSFDWFISNIYPEFNGQKIITEQYKQLHLDRIGCLSYEQSSRSVVMTLCELPLKGPLSNQAWVITGDGQIKHQSLCLTKMESSSQLYLTQCISKGTEPHSSNQTFKLTKDSSVGTIIHAESNLCLDIQKMLTDITVLLQTCDVNSRTQQWLSIV